MRGRLKVSPPSADRQSGLGMPRDARGSTTRHNADASLLYRLGPASPTPGEEREDAGRTGGSTHEDVSGETPATERCARRSAERPPEEEVSVGTRGDAPVEENGPHGRDGRTRRHGNTGLDTGVRTQSCTATDRSAGTQLNTCAEHNIGANRDTWTNGSSGEELEPPAPPWPSDEREKAVQGQPDKA